MTCHWGLLLLVVSDVHDVHPGTFSIKTMLFYLLQVVNFFTPYSRVLKN